MEYFALHGGGVALLLHDGDIYYSYGVAAVGIVLVTALLWIFFLARGKKGVRPVYL